ncbi:hypothetical protein AWC05_20590 [Mycobacterium florentinum]|uniref:Putative succinate-semialdehyde dehydrogenase [NADP(+)] 2 n=1 Tax=Mycobacterium florentinum TaxID=292462 RepID=A0A1X1U8K5_MYCFL|nr:aldehyde dehydrogenase family protein [Mycobacterium florentinum]MCV7410625.1 aldehyde dehydrogenase family protein [Mycobacterium florentinum]ORV53142.1 hypothetical protein AWC05_20590 [Mycobacterium florentinum]BBX79949.1 aldehyde dehydrogenase [Mycobacterium florentinum]
MTTIETDTLLVAGTQVRAKNQTAVVNPATGRAFAQCPVASDAHLQLAVESADAARAAWARDADLRRRVLLGMAEMLSKNRDLLAKTLTQEIGVPLRDTTIEVAGAAAFAKFRGAAPLPVEQIHDDARQSVQVNRAPVGIVGAIVPWNAPLLISAEKIATAFAAGNVVVLKPSLLAPLTTVLLGSLLADIVPPGVLHVLPGDDDLGKALVAHQKVGMISFTGSIAAGRAIMAAAAPRLKRLSLELGGNDAAIVLPDVDIPRVASQIFRSAFYRSGQVCAAIKRLYVHKDIRDEFVAALADVADNAAVGDPFDPDVTMGPISNRPQFDRVRRLVADAVAAGGTIVAGGHPIARDGYFHAPTLVTGVGPGIAVVDEEQFGPVLPIQSFTDIDAAVAAANDSDYGLGASVWTADTTAGAAIAADLDAGSVWVNRHGIVSPEVPFGGMKQSGVGRANGAPGLDQYSELKTVSVAIHARKPTP